MSELNAIARRIAEAFNRRPEDGQAMVSGYYADTVEMRHSPPGLMDGPVAASELRRGLEIEMPVFRKALADLRVEAVTDVEGDTVVLEFTYYGTAGGKDVRIPFLCDFRFQDGKIVAIHARLTNESRKIVQGLFAAAGLTPETFAAEMATAVETT